MRVLITGGLRGIGRALAVHMQAAGHAVYICDNGCQADGIQAARDDMPAPVPGCQHYRASLATMAGCQQVAEAMEAFPRLDALVHCAAVSLGTAWDIMDVNSSGTIYLTELLLQNLQASDGAVMFFSSGVVSESFSWEARWYAASKAALETYARVLSEKITTFTVRPSARTRMNPNATTEPDDIASTCKWLLEERPGEYRGRVLSLPGEGVVRVVV